MSSPYPAPPQYPSRFPGGYPGPHQAPPAPTLAIVALVAGILSLVLIPAISVLAIPLGIAAIVTGCLGVSRRTPGRGMAIAGLVTGAVGVLVNVVVTAVLFAFYGGLLLFGLLAPQGGFTLDQGDEYDYGYGDPGVSAGEFSYGESAVLTDYVVSVDAVHTEGDVLYADVTAQYTGTGTGSSYYDLYGYAYDADGEEIDATDCDEAVNPDAADLPDVDPGQTVTFQMCFEGIDDPAGAWVEVQDGYSWADWSDSVTLEGPSNTGV